MHDENKFSTRESNELNHFDQLSGQYDSNYGYDRAFTLYKLDKKSTDFARLVRRHNTVKSPLILELGCGTGEYTKRIASMVPEATFVGLDISPKIVELAKEKCKSLSNVSFTVTSAYQTGLSDHSVDIVCGFYALHHFDITAIQKEIFRILRPGGLVFFYEPNILNPMVYIIKSSPSLKKRVGDSPDEWAINPITIGKSFPGFDVLRKYTTEFIWPIRIIPDKVLKQIDKLTSVLSHVPVINLFGGSLVLCLRKKEN